MYIPRNFLATDREEIIAFMKQFSFATIITANDNIPVATHLPFTVSIKDGEIILMSHFAKANVQWTAIEEREVLVIFMEPHAYISPQHYEIGLSVPTWNYISVHAYGQGEIITDATESFDALRQMINNYDAGYEQQWDQLPKDFKLKMLKGITVFKIKVTDLQAKKKLSQNRSSVEQERIIQALSRSDNQQEKTLSVFMKLDQKIN